MPGILRFTEVLLTSIQYPVNFQIKISPLARAQVEICLYLKSPKHGAPSICGVPVFLSTVVFTKKAVHLFTAVGHILSVIEKESPECIMSVPNIAPVSANQGRDNYLSQGKSFVFIAKVIKSMSVPLEVRLNLIVDRLNEYRLYGKVANLERKVSCDCTTLLEHVIINRRSCFNTDFLLQIKLAKLPLIRCFTLTVLVK